MTMPPTTESFASRPSASKSCNPTPSSSHSRGLRSQPLIYEFIFQYIHSACITKHFSPLYSTAGAGDAAASRCKNFLGQTWLIWQIRLDFGKIETKFDKSD